ncbi:MAG: nitrile hydratase subunit alpha [Alphaproteobacteria bacterium]|jgi:nitrile hydratase|nr:nitrile hydratase subunit alpha [Alphaproteobacteria bacterium]
MSTHDHTHDHGHDHTTFQPDITEPSEDWEFLEITLRELLIDKGVITAREVQDQIEAWEKKSPEGGAKIVARAWTDRAFRRRLLEDGNAAVAEMGFEVEALKLIALENTNDLHHMVVCTLCSCYPRPLLGMPPLWYKSREYRSRAVREPRAVLKEFGTALPESMEVRVVDSTADCRYLVLPRRPQGTEGMSEAELADLVSRDSMIGTAEAFGSGGVR